MGYYAEEESKVIETWTFGSLQVLVMVDKACGVSCTGLRIWPAAQSNFHWNEIFQKNFQ